MTTSFYQPSDLSLTQQSKSMRTYSGDANSLDLYPTLIKSTLLLQELELVYVSWVGIACQKVHMLEFVYSKRRYINYVHTFRKIVPYLSM